jgi:hypothetical protein
MERVGRTVGVEKHQRDLDTSANEMKTEKRLVKEVSKL